ncbi:MAG TPA: hypothetical protein ENI79_05605 [Rhodospirillales bacterium]|nr:hypothetical protein [Rhodospirillales bacterium]
MKKIELSLTPKSQAPEERPEPQAPHAPPKQDQPVMGYFAVGFGLAGIFVNGVVFVPLGLICSILALFMGQYVWGVVGLLVGVMGFLTTPLFLLFVGMKVLHVYLVDLYNEWFGGGWFKDFFNFVISAFKT